MIRHLTANGLTSTSTTFLEPNVGYRWRILSILAWLVAGTGTGTRALTVSVAPYQTSGGVALEIANTGNQTGSSASYFTSLLGASNPSSLAGNGYIRYSDLYADASAHLAVQPTLITGDTYGYDIQVLEEPDI